MHLYAAIMPPTNVLEAVTRVVRDAEVGDSSQSSEKSSKRGVRFGRRRSGEEAADEPLHPASAARQLDLVTPDRMQMPIATFGNLAVADVARLTEAIRAVAATLTPPTLRLSGSAALEFPGDQSVWAKIEGDLDVLRLIPPAITRIVEPLGFFVDRRQFRPMLSVATITDATNIEVLERVVETLDAFEGEPWTVGHVSLRKKRLDLDPPSSEEIAHLPLGP